MVGAGKPKNDCRADLYPAAGSQKQVGQCGAMDRTAAPASKGGWNGQ